MEARTRQRHVAKRDGEPGQIKSRERVRDLAEVYTHEREVNAMLDLVPDMFPSAERPGQHGPHLPGAGLRRTATSWSRSCAASSRYVTPRRYGRGERFEHRVLRCLASIYGIDISARQRREARERMRAVIAQHLACHLGADDPTAGFGGAVEAILETNVIRADTLADAAEIELVEYQPGSARHLHPRVVAPARPGRERAQPVLARRPRRDEVPVHYSELARQTEPVRADSVERKAA